MSRREESVPFILVHDCPWWVSALLAGVVYWLMKEVAPGCYQENSIMGPIMKAMPGCAWLGATVLLILSGLNLWVRFLKRVVQRNRAEKQSPNVGGATHEVSVLLNVADTPRCPDCGRAMIKRTARRGANAGNLFWGCEAFPVCKGTRN